MLSEKTLLVISPYPKDEKDIQGIFVKEQVDAVSNYFRKVEVISPVSFSPFLRKRNGENYAYRNVKVHFIHYPKLPVKITMGVSFDFTGLKSILNYIKKQKINFDIIHTHFTWPWGYTGWKIKQKYRKPFVETVHENSKWLIREYLSGFSKIYSTWKNADFLIRVNNRDIHLLKKFNPNVAYIPNGINLKIFKRCNNKEFLKIKKNLKIIFSAGNLVKRKGYEFLIKAMKEVVNKRKDVLCLIAGDGPLRNLLLNMINSMQLKNYIKLVGKIPHTKLPLWMNAADIFVLPSLSESFGVVQIEAMACGVPVVATNNPGSLMLIKDERLGIIVKRGNPTQLADGILKALEKKWNKEYIMKFAKNFSWESVSQKLIELYKNLLQKEVKT